jgi:hypothetical protein
MLDLRLAKSLLNELGSLGIERGQSLSFVALNCDVRLGSNTSN